MKQISVPPGALKFRLVMTVILVIIFMLVFFNYTNRISVTLEKTSIQQTKNIINSTLMVVFASYAVKGELESLNELIGSNPFRYLETYSQLPTTYRGDIGVDKSKNSTPGWYYDGAKGVAIYKPLYDDKDYYFRIELDYRDVDGSGKFEPAVDQFWRLSFRQLPRQ
jgi:hypothetical protein